MTWSDGGSYCSREDDTDLVAFASKIDNAGGDCGVGPSKNTTGVTDNVLTLTYKSSDDEDLTKNALIKAYWLIHTKWTELTKVCEKVYAQNRQSNIERNNLQKINTELESKLKESQDEVVKLKAELEKMKKLVNMINYSSSKLDEILFVERIEK